MKARGVLLGSLCSCFLTASREFSSSQLVKPLDAKYGTRRFADNRVSVGPQPSQTLFQHAAANDDQVGSEALRCIPHACCYVALLNTERDLHRESPDDLIDFMTCFLDKRMFELLIDLIVRPPCRGRHDVHK